MRGRIVANRLNVRRTPAMGENRIGVLERDALVEILGHRDDWYEIAYGGASAFVADDYVEPIETPRRLKARVRAARLNVRDAPGMHGRIRGQLVRDSLVDVLEEQGNWLAIPFNGETAWIGRRFVDLLLAERPERGRVTARRLNVRSAPRRDAPVLGVLESGQVLDLLSRIGDWYEIRFNGLTAFVAARFVQGEPAADDDRAPQPDELAESPDAVSLAPPVRAPVRRGAAGKAARTWNRYGGLLTVLGDRHGIAPASAVAVFCVESSGEGFDANNGNRLIIRFENHKFWKYWGREHSARFHDHFRYNRRKPWQGHRWRPDAAAEWETFHGSQAKEWQVLTFARELDDTAALLSISMGAPQIMGFHYARLGYDSVQAMFEAFGRDMRAQIEGFFAFLDPRMLKALRNEDFTAFARAYNGSGQAEKYGKWIRKYYDAFRSLDVRVT